MCALCRNARHSCTKGLAVIITNIKKGKSLVVALWFWVSVYCIGLRPNSIYCDVGVCVRARALVAKGRGRGYAIEQ